MKNGSFIVRFDDIAPGMAWHAFLPLKRKLERLGVRCVLGVVPDCRDPGLKVEAERSDFFALVREWAEYGDTIAQHGTYHVYDTEHGGLLQINRRSEFAGHPYSQQYARLAHGKSILQREGVWQPYFMAPSHSFDVNTLRALYDLGFTALTDGYGFHPYEVERLVLVPQLVGRPLNISIGVQTICMHINSASAELVQSLIEFVTANQPRIVNFKDVASAHPTPTRVSSVLRHASKMVLSAARSMRGSSRKLSVG